MKRFLAALCFLAAGFRAGAPLLVVPASLTAGCSIVRNFQNPDARLVAVYADIQGATDLAAHLLRTGKIKPEEAQVVHDGLATALRHADAAKDIMIKAKREDRTASKEELRKAWSILDLAQDALVLARDYLAAKGGKS